MYRTSGVDAVATITELRSKTSDLIEYARNSDHGVLIQKNNEPYAVLLDWEMYQELIGERAEPDDRPPKRRKRNKGDTPKEKANS